MEVSWCLTHMGLCTFRIIAALALIATPCCSPRADEPRPKNSFDLPVPPALARDIALQAVPKEEFVSLGLADYAGGTFGCKERYKGRLGGAWRQLSEPGFPSFPADVSASPTPLDIDQCLTAAQRA